jgi:hypothetical protein
MPTVRGRFIRERHKARASKRSFDILLWIEHLQRADVAHLDLLEQLRVYLTARFSGVCELRLLVPSTFTETRELLSRFRIFFVEVATPAADEAFLAAHPDLSDPVISHAAVSAKTIAADCIVVPSNSEMLPFIEELRNSLHTLITDTSFLLTVCDVYVRGFEIPWTHRHMIWDMPWMTFYLWAEAASFSELMRLTNAMQTSGCDQEFVQANISLSMVRLPQISFTRDRLLWLDLQREAARRDGFVKTYAFEISYYLNAYYLLLSGTFDHLALIVNGVYALGIPERNVGATYKAFLEPLKQQSTTMHGLFTRSDTVDLIARFAQLRNLAAHRGAITPRNVVEAPDHEPTPEELRKEIERAGMAWIFDEPYRSHSGADTLIKTALANARAAIYERGKRIADDVTMIELNGKTVFVSPLLDTTWNYRQVLHFAKSVADECLAHLNSTVTSTAAL